MKEDAYIIMCLKRIEEALQWGDSNEWTDYEFKKLSGAIKEKTGTVISTHTLKRLYGKIAYKPRHNPQIATKNALAMFLDYHDWEDFIKQHKDEALDTSKYDRFGKKPNRAWLFVLIIIFVVVIAGFLVFQKNRIANPRYDFEVLNKEGLMPHTITYRYDVSDIRKDVEVDFGFRHPDYINDRKVLDKARHVLNYTYQVPGYYCTKLLIKGQPVDSADIVVRSGGWVSFILKEGKINRYWLDNMIGDQKYMGILALTPREINMHGGDTNKVYYTLHRFIKPLGISGDHCDIYIRFRNGPGNGGITCYDSEFRFIGRERTSFVRFMEKNCHRFSGVKFGETIMNGEYEDLSAFGRELDQWNDLNIIIKDKHANVIFNGLEIYACDYQEPIGEIVGLEARFKGSGQVTFIEIKDEAGNMYVQDF